MHISTHFHHRPIYLGSHNIFYEKRGKSVVFKNHYIVDAPTVNKLLSLDPNKVKVAKFKDGSTLRTKKVVRVPFCEVASVLKKISFHETAPNTIILPGYFSPSVMNEHKMNLPNDVATWREVWILNKLFPDHTFVYGEKRYTINQNFTEALRHCTSRRFPGCASSSKQAPVEETLENAVHSPAHGVPQESQTIQSVSSTQDKLASNKSQSLEEGKEPASLPPPIPKQRKKQVSAEGTKADITNPSACVKIEDAQSILSTKSEMTQQPLGYYNDSTHVFWFDESYSLGNIRSENVKKILEIYPDLKDVYVGERRMTKQAISLYTDPDKRAHITEYEYGILDKTSKIFYLDAGYYRYGFRYVKKKGFDILRRISRLCPECEYVCFTDGICKTPNVAMLYTECRGDLSECDFGVYNHHTHTLHLKLDCASKSIDSSLEKLCEQFPELKYIEYPLPSEKNNV